MIQPQSPICDPRVSVVRVVPAEYRDEGLIEQSVARAVELLNWDQGRSRPFGNIVHPDDRVLIKPNLVTHQNQGPWGMEPLITHRAHILAVARAVLASQPFEVLIGDAPVQGCDFETLLHDSGIGAACEDLRQADERFKGIVDFRRTSCDFVAGVRRPHDDLRELDRFVLFDLQGESLLEEITTDERAFRVTCYDPQLLANTHSKGKHQYLVAREAIEADLVINLPKLKTHKKAGMTCAMKNLIGINGNKEYLPHHRIGGAASGGDCYPDASTVKKSWEYALDRMNSAGSLTTAFAWRQTATQLGRLASITGDKFGVEGSWSGNDTIWRTCLDLNRILIYGRTDGALADAPQRRVINIADGVIAGQGDGPLKPQPLGLGVIVAGVNPAAVDLVGSRLLCYQAERIPCVRNAFAHFRWPLTEFSALDVAVCGDLGESIEEVGTYSKRFEISHPIGWTDAKV